MRIRVAKALVALIQEAQSTALLQQILGTSTTDSATTEKVDLEDPV
jgi:hypothetical protein